MPNFRNLFCLYGPGTNLAFGGSVIFNSECEVRYTLGGLKAILQGGHSTIDVKQSVHDAYNERLQEEHAGMIWAHPSIKNSWYQNSEGKVTVLSPWRLLDFWTWTQAPDPDDYRLS